MNLNRRKNIFTLGDFQHKPTPFLAGKATQSRRQNSDPFERDPFKIQSYNFRYADRPTFPLQNLVNRVSNNSTEKRFETYYYNHDFTSSRHDKENSSSNKFHEHRRRKFLHDQQNAPTTPNSRMPTYYQHQQGSPRETTTAATTTSINNANKGSSIYMSPYANAFNAPTSSPLLRRGCAREFVQGVPTIYSSNAHGSTHSIMQQQQQHHHHQHSCDNSQRSCGCHTINSSSSRASLIACGSTTGRRIYAASERSPTVYGYSSTTGIPIRTHREQIPARSCPSAQNMNRGTAQPGSRVQTTRSTCSGCQININIKSLDDNQPGENVIIQIESDRPACIETGTNNINAAKGKSSRLHNSPSIANNLSMRTTSPNTDNFNIGPFRSTETFVINKRISKFSVTDSDLGSNRNNSIVSNSSISKTNKTSLKRTASDRIPSLVPWKTDDTVRKCFQKNANGSTKLGYVDYSTPMQRRTRGANTSKTSQMRTQPVMATASALGVAKTNGMHSTSMHIGTKTSNCTNKPTASGSKVTQLKKPPNVTNKPSRSSLRSNYENTSINASNIRRNADTQVRKSASCVYSNRHKLDKSPVNVNINVYADKLKLMRV